MKQAIVKVNDTRVGSGVERHNIVGSSLNNPSFS